MKSVKIMLLLALSSTALAVPTMASASIWTKEGVQTPFNEYPAWSDEGAPLDEATSISLSGTFQFTSAVVGGIKCTLSASGTLTPVLYGQLTSASISAPSCTTSGPLAPCKVDSTSMGSLPWDSTATEKSGVKSISVTGVSITYKLVSAKGGACGVVPQATLTGDFTATPDNSLAMTSLTPSGTMKVGGSNVIMGGSLSVTPSGKLGIITLKETHEAELDGYLAYTSSFEGGVECPVEGTIALVGGTNEGAVTAITWDAESCALYGPKAACGKVTSVTTNSLPWSAVNEGTSIKINVGQFTINYSNCAPQSFAKGELTATPDKVSAISSTVITGQWETGGGGLRPATGSLNWTPAGVYGLQ